MGIFYGVQKKIVCNFICTLNSLFLPLILKAIMIFMQHILLVKYYLCHQY